MAKKGEERLEPFTEVLNMPFGKLSLQKKSPTEHQIQSAFMEEVAWMSNSDWRLKYVYAVPNGGFRQGQTALTLQREGVKPGVPDIVVPIPTKYWPGLYIEFKTEKGRVRPVQKKWLKGLRRLGYCTAVCRSAQEGIDLLKKYLHNILVPTEARFHVDTP